MSSTTNPSGKDHWSTQTYSAAASFVPKLTTKLLTLIDPQPTDRILDLGCGDGKFTSTLLPHVTEILGLDSSPSFIASAQAYSSPTNPKATFTLHDVRSLSTHPPAMHGKWDKIISNAALHWILAAPHPSIRLSVFQNSYAALRPGGHLIFEMGGAGNVAEVHSALVMALHHHAPMSLAEARSKSPWFFPSEAWMRKTLEGIGFEVGVCELEYRPTACTRSEGGGLRGWLELMGAPWLECVPETQGRREKAICEVVECLRDVCGREDEGAVGEGRSEWLGYVRLRVKARKPEGSQ